MHLLTPILPDPDAPLALANPVAKLAAALLLLIALFASVDGITAAIVLVVLLLLLPLSGIRPADLLARSWLVGLAALSIAVFNVVFAADQAGSLIGLGPVRFGTDTVLAGASLAVRLVAIVVAGMLATATTDPTDLADALIQQLRVSPRFAVGALAALRLVPLFAQEWQTLAMARRARGVDAGRSPVAWLRLVASQLLALLVGAIRRGSRMATAMEARGFGARDCRTSARPQRMGWRDWGWVAGALLLAAGAVAASVALGTWRPLFG